jgi:hypothetical protein
MLTTQCLYKYVGQIGDRSMSWKASHVHGVVPVLHVSTCSKERMDNWICLLLFACVIPLV